MDNYNKKVYAQKRGKNKKRWKKKEEKTKAHLTAAIPDRD